jgi:Glyoxalase-like domain
MLTRLQVAIDCADPEPLVRFWSTALGYVPEPPPEGYPDWFAYWRAIGIPEEELGPDTAAVDSVVDPAGVGPRIWFQTVPEAKTIKNRVHLDLGVSGGRTVPLAIRRERVDAEVERLVAAGATVLWKRAEPGMDHYAVTMADPEGNEFCVH